MFIDQDQRKRFIQFRKKHIGTQKLASEICECSQKNISEIENGLTSISLDIVRHLYFKRNLSVDWLFTGGEGMRRGELPKENLIQNIRDYKAELEISNANIKRLDYLVQKIYADYYGVDAVKPGRYPSKARPKPEINNEKSL